MASLTESTVATRKKAFLLSRLQRDGLTRLPMFVVLAEGCDKAAEIAVKNLSPLEPKVLGPTMASNQWIEVKGLGDGNRELLPIEEFPVYES